MLMRIFYFMGLDPLCIPLAEQDLEKAIKTAEYLDKHQWGHSLEESRWLRCTDAEIRFLRWQRRMRNRMSG